MTALNKKLLRDILHLRGQVIAITLVVVCGVTRLNIVGIALSPEYVYAIQAGSLFPDNRRFGIIWMSREAMGPAFDLDGAFNDVVVKLTPDASEPEVMARLDRVLEPYGGLTSYGRDDHVSDRLLSDEIRQNRQFGVVLMKQISRPRTTRRMLHSSRSLGSGLHRRAGGQRLEHEMLGRVKALVHLLAGVDIDGTLLDIIPHLAHLRLRRQAGNRVVGAEADEEEPGIGFADVLDANAHLRQI
jgi:hypothetical protein